MEVVVVVVSVGGLCIYLPNHLPRPMSPDSVIAHGPSLLHNIARQRFQNAVRTDIVSCRLASSPSAFALAAVQQCSRTTGR